MWVFVVALVVTLVLALCLLAVVLISSGRLDGSKFSQHEKFEKLEHLADTTNRHLNGRGTPPKAFVKLDERYGG